eukprot:4266190-Amphidinium_carterae.1
MGIGLVVLMCRKLNLMCQKLGPSGIGACLDCLCSCSTRNFREWVSLVREGSQDQGAHFQQLEDGLHTPHTQPTSMQMPLPQRPEAPRQQPSQQLQEMQSTQPMQPLQPAMHNIQQMQLPQSQLAQSPFYQGPLSSYEQMTQSPQAPRPQPSQQSAMHNMQQMQVPQSQLSQSPTSQFPAVRQVMAVVPAGSGPGSLLTVTTPDGKAVQVQVPAGAMAGQSIVFQC